MCRSEFEVGRREVEVGRNEVEVDTQTHIYTHTHIHTHTQMHKHTRTHTHTHHVPVQSNGIVSCASNEIRDSIDNQTCQNHQFQHVSLPKRMLDSAINVCVRECVYMCVFLFLVSALLSSTC